MDMKYYRHRKTGEVYAYENDEQRKQFGPAELVPMSADEVEAHISQSPAPLTRDQIEAMRLGAYADPITGSDRFLTEAAAERLNGNEEKAKEAEAKCLSRRAEIAAEHPWPEDN